MNDPGPTRATVEHAIGPHGDTVGPPRVSVEETLLSGHGVNLEQLSCGHIGEVEVETYLMANYWLEFGIDRKGTKKSVMTLPYGVTFFSGCIVDLIYNAVLTRSSQRRPERLGGGLNHAFAHPSFTFEIRC